MWFILGFIHLCENQQLNKAFAQKRQHGIKSKKSSIAVTNICFIWYSLGDLPLWSDIFLVTNCDISCPCDLYVHFYSKKLLLHKRPLQIYGLYGMADSVDYSAQILHFPYLTLALTLTYYLINSSVGQTNLCTQMISYENIQFNRILVLKIKMAKMNRYRWWLVLGWIPRFFLLLNFSFLGAKSQKS